MSDIQGLRAQLRDTSSRPAPRVSSSGGGGGGAGGLSFWIMAAIAAALGFAIVLLTPRFFTTQRTASLPAFQGAANRAEPADTAPASAPAPAPQQHAAAQPAPAQPAPANASRYAGKSLEDIVNISEAVCEHRAQAVRLGAQPAKPAAKPGADDPAGNHKVTAADEKLHCFLTEAPARFCAPNQKRKATADIINYFKGIEYANRAVIVAAKLQGAKVDAGSMPSVAAIDPRVVVAIEGLMRAGYLVKAHRDEIGANVPQDIKVRFAPIVGSTPNCPKPPWWAAFL